MRRNLERIAKQQGLAGDLMCLPLYGYKKYPDNPRKWIIDDKAAEVVRRVYQLRIEGRDGSNAAGE